ncbi:hypothetical protein DSO57_1033251 [Entomophthora muscae]|uniref:Uncharacterized protein n=1 Tax=Entomophthora muscae TaxID=34485 RepID=A0ACC2T021_9FUNG|nr:hypothetical protein DSO57_1033251 [Entomophthora muscae]
MRTRLQKRKAIPRARTSPVKSQAYLKLRLEQLASTAQNIISDPEKNYSSLKILKALSVDKNIQIRKYALLTQLSVFMDILPGLISPMRALMKKRKRLKKSLKRKVAVCLKILFLFIIIYADELFSFVKLGDWPAAVGFAICDLSMDAASVRLFHEDERGQTGLHHQSKS